MSTNRVSHTCLLSLSSQKHAVLVPNFPYSYTSLNHITSDLLPASRLIHPNLSTFSGLQPYQTRKRERVVTHRAHHPYTLKAAPPCLSGMLYKEVWEEHIEIGRESRLALERMVVGLEKSGEDLFWIDLDGTLNAKAVLMSRGGT
ncbi:hypothetical protein PM082_023218 [Marasmius tenuissimus]|nr:hypothetical protein PM082_023218 [Marasmius tenuissimus]